MTKLFTTNYGSFLYGTNTPTSDVDYKHVVLPSLDDMLLLKRISNEVHKTNSEKNTKNSADDVDEEFIPIQILAKDFLGGQTYALELAYAVDYTKANQIVHDPRIVTFCHELRSQFLTSNMAALVGYAVNQASLYSLKGERLNTLRAAEELFSNMRKRTTSDSTLYKYEHMFEALAEKIAEEFPKYFQLTTYVVDQRGTQKKAIKLLEKILPYSNSFETNLKSVQAQLSKYGSRADAASIDNVDWKATMHALRVVDEGISLLTDKTLVFPFCDEYVNLLLNIKGGQLPYPDVIEMINHRLDVLKDLEAKSELPKKTPELSNKLDEWLANWMHDFYGI